MTPDKIRCDACPVNCLIADGMTGACDRYANASGTLIRTDPHLLLDRAVDGGADLVAFLDGDESGSTTFVTAIGAGTTYPDYKPAPFTVSSQIDGVDMVTVVTEGIFSYCGVKVKIDTDRFLGPEGASVRAAGQPIGNVTTGEYGSQMLSLGGVHHLTGGSKREGRVTCDTLLDLCNRKPVDLTIDGGAALTAAAGQPPIIDGTPETRMRVGCGSTTIGMFAQQWLGLVDEVVVVDDHITGVISEHQAGKVIAWPDTTVLFMGGAGGSLRSGVTDNPVRLTWSVKNAVTRVTCGGAPTYVWPGGGITFMVDVTKLPEGAFGSVPTPALVAPIEFSLPLDAYIALGGHTAHIRPLATIAQTTPTRVTPNPTNPWPLSPSPSGRGPG